MKSSALCCTLVLLLAATGSAGDVFVPANTPGTGPLNYYPFHPGFAPEWRYQLLLSARLMGTTAFNITEIAFAPSGTGTLTSQDFEVRMSHTKAAASTTFATNLPNPVVVLPAGTHVWHTTDKQWSPIGLTSAFAYNGVDSLTVEIRYRNGTLSLYPGQCYFDNKAFPRIYANSTTAYTATTGMVEGSGLKIRITYTNAYITGSGSPSIGQTFALDLLAATDAGLPYQVGTSLGTGPIPMDTRMLRLSPDDLLVLSVQGTLPQVFSGYVGLLDNGGKAQAKLHTPNIPGLVGIRLHSAFVTIKNGAPSNLASISPTCSFTITK